MAVSWQWDVHWTGWAPFWGSLEDWFNLLAIVQFFFFMGVSTWTYHMTAFMNQGRIQFYEDKGKL